ncbi:unnamed protein product [Ectocarpus sp. CCAP 1310/34]|nr:unnamed protein product [Ectocarpus sp. CCAP 1310/34]
MEDEEEGGQWKESAKDPEVWYNKVEDGAAWFMRNWHRQEAEAFAKRQRAREAERSREYGLRTEEKESRGSGGGGEETATGHCCRSE